jgi:hypothetical protein
MRGKRAEAREAAAAAQGLVKTPGYFWKKAGIFGSHAPSRA